MYIAGVHSESEDHFGVSSLLHLYLDSGNRAQAIRTVWQVLYLLSHLTVPTRSFLMLAKVIIMVTNILFNLYHDVLAGFVCYLTQARVIRKASMRSSCGLN